MMFAKTFSRRGVLGAAGSAIAAPFLSRPALSQQQELSDEEVAKILLEEASEPDAKIGRETIGNYWFQLPAGQRPSPNWPTDNLSYDYHHTSSIPDSNEPFILSSDVLERLLQLCSFERNVTLPKMIFGLRGCSLADGSETSQWLDGCSLSTTRPDHINQKCVFAIWDTEARKVRVFRGSTVPNVDLMQKYNEKKLACNMMPSGFHPYHIGAHKGLRMPGAFRQQEPLWVIRSRENLVYSISDKDDLWDDLDGQLPFDDIHWTFFSPSRQRPPFFSSAGCQTVSAWGIFRQSAGLKDPPQILDSTGSTPDDGKQFQYALLTGKDAQLASQPGSKFAPTLRYGSSGSTVRKLQDSLVAANVGYAQGATGKFDRHTMGAVFKWQRAHQLPDTGIVTETDAQTMGFQLSN